MFSYLLSELILTVVMLQHFNPLIFAKNRIAKCRGEVRMLRKMLSQHIFTINNDRPRIVIVNKHSARYYG